MTDLHLDTPSLDQPGLEAPTVLNDRAWHLRRQDANEALRLARDAKLQAEKVGDDHEVARSLCTIGNILAFSDEHSDAGPLLERALELCEQIGAPKTTAWTLYGMAKLNYRMRNIKDALATAVRMREHCREHDIQNEEAHALNALGAIYQELGIYQQALVHFRDSLDLYKAIGDHDNVVIPLFNINLIYSELGEYNHALTYAQAAADAFATNGDELNATGSLMHIGELYTYLGRYPEALDHLERARELFRNQGRRFFQAETHYYLANLHRRREAFDEARHHYRTALDMLQPGNHDASRVQILTGYGELHLLEGDPATAAELLGEALAVAEAKELKKDLYEVHLALSKSCKALGDLEGALAHFETFHAIKEELAEEKLRSVLEGLQLQFDVEKGQRHLVADRLISGEVARLNQKLRILSEQLEEQSIRDELTRLYNRRHLNQAFAEEFARSRRHRHKLSVVMCDIDFFKKINDTYSHATGDEVLRTVATILTQGVRSSDLVARYGGEEFALVLPETSCEAAREVSEKIRAKVENYDWSRIHPTLTVTMSFGVSADTDVDSYEQLLNRADAKLYEAKDAGRNRVES